MQSAPWATSLQCIKLGRSNSYFFHAKLVPIEAGRPMDPAQGWHRAVPGLHGTSREILWGQKWAGRQGHQTVEGKGLRGHEVFPFMQTTLQAWRSQGLLWQGKYVQRKSHGLIGDLKGSGNGNSDNHQTLFLNQMSFKILFLWVLNTVFHFIAISWK